MMKHTLSCLRVLLTPAVIGLLLVAGAPALAQTVNYSPATLSFSPAGPYSVPRDAAVGSQVARAQPIHIQTENLLRTHVKLNLGARLAFQVL